MTTELPHLNGCTLPPGPERDRVAAVVAQHYRSGMTSTEIGRIIGRSHRAVLLLVREAGAPVRSAGWRAGRPRGSQQRPRGRTAPHS